jgi:hypothetical protein
MTRILAYTLAGLIFIATPMDAHDHWINHGQYLDPVTGQHCCSEQDCQPLSEADIETIMPTGNGGLTVQGFTFQRGQLHKSEDGKWYRCANRCVFRPVEG